MTAANCAIRAILTDDEWALIAPLKARQRLGEPQSQGPRILAPRLNSPHAAKALQSQLMFPDRLLHVRILEADAMDAAGETLAVPQRPPNLQAVWRMVRRPTPAIPI